MIKPNHFKTGNVKIGIDLHNLSLKTDSNVRTGIQQVVFNLLEAQYLLRNKTKNTPIELIPLPMLPKHSESWSFFPNLMDTNVNNSSFVLKSVSEEAMRLIKNDIEKDTNDTFLEIIGNDEFGRVERNEYKN